jgi:DNA-binding winged helix-turn-helix (wHTH) protein
MLYVFEAYTLDTRRYELRRAGELVPLDRQVFEVLAYLLAHPDQVVTRQELFTHLWPERFVSDAALERCITVARRALGDNGREQRCIKTVHGRSYRFVATVATRPDAEPRPLALASPLAPSPCIPRRQPSRIGDYPRAVENLQRNVATHQGEMRYERFGAIGSVSATSRAWLSYCQAECGAFTAGLAMAEEGLRLAEIAHDPFSQIEACYGVSVVYRRQGDMPRALPMLERAIGLCQEWHIPLFLPRYTAALGLTYALEGRVAAGLALVEQGMEQTVARGRPRGLALVVTWLSEAYLLAGRLEEARQRAAQAVDLARQHQQRGTPAWALWLLGESTARQASPEGEPAADYYRQALTLAAELGMRPLQAHCHVSLGTLYVKIGQRE